MTLKDGFIVVLGIIAGLGILLLSFFAGAAILSATNKGEAVYLNLSLPVIAGIAVWFRRQKHPSPFLNGLLIGICLACCFRRHAMLW